MSPLHRVGVTADFSQAIKHLAKAAKRETICESSLEPRSRLLCKYGKIKLGSYKICS